jgi:diacylglycerol O-acyltransferase
MPHLHPSDRLTSEDAVFLYSETKETPLHIGSVSIFDGPIPFRACVDYVQSRLPLIERYRQRIVVPPFNLGHPTWEDDADFDIRNHIHHARLKHGTEAELQALAGRVFSELMDRSRPLWDMTVVDGLIGGRSALLSRVHHCLVDGVSGVGLFNVMLDPNFKPPAEDHRAFHPRPVPGPEASIADALASSYSEMLTRFISAQAASLNIAEALVSNPTALHLDQVARFLPELLAPVDRLPFNKPCNGPRRVAWSEISIPEVSAIRAACGGTLNDVALTVVTGAVRRYAQHHGEAVKNRLLRLMVPVSLRRNGESNGLGNRVSLLPVSIPLDISDPIELLKAIHQRTEALKASRVADLIYLFATWMGATPVPVQALMGAFANLLPAPPFNLVCTNVPGPQLPLYLLGCEMLTYYPYVPIGNGMGIGWAIQSYNRKLFFGLTADAEVAGDTGRLKRFFDQSFRELRQQAGIRATAPNRAGKMEKVRNSAVERVGLSALHKTETALHQLA